MIGHGLGAAGGLEAIATIKAINTGWLHPTINQDVLHSNLIPSILILFTYIIIVTIIKGFPIYTCVYYVQDLEPSVTIDTVPNVKKQHEVHVGMCVSTQ